MIVVLLWFDGGSGGSYEESLPQIRKTGSYEVSPPNFAHMKYLPPSFAHMKNLPPNFALLYKDVAKQWNVLTAYIVSKDTITYILNMHTLFHAVSIYIC